MKRVVTAFLLAPVSYPVGVTLLSPLSGGLGDNEFTIEPILWMAPVTYIVTLVFGVPAYLVFRKLRLTKWWQYTSGGFFIGSVAWAAFIAAFLGTPDMKSVAWGGAIGAVSAFVFWLIAFLSVRLTPHATT